MRNKYYRKLAVANVHLNGVSIKLSMISRFYGTELLSNPLFILFNYKNIANLKPIL